MIDQLFGGKSTLQEMLHHPPNPIPKAYGLSDKQRTTIPELVVCGERVLDNLELSDVTISKGIDESPIIVMTIESNELRKGLVTLFVTCLTQTRTTCCWGR
jgi:hypothetical protein